MRLAAACLLAGGAAHGQGPGGAPATPTSLVAPVAILAAIPAEFAAIAPWLQQPQATSLGRVQFLRGTLDGRDVVLARVGVGKVNAALATTLLLDHFHPRAILFSGVAGALAPDLAPGDIVIASRTAQHDLGRQADSTLIPFGARPASDTASNPIYFPADTMLLRVATAVAPTVHFTSISAGGTVHYPQVRTGTVLTGDVFLQSNTRRAVLRQQLSGDAVEMEGAAVAQVAWQWQRTPTLVIRSISDAADGNAPGTFATFRDVAAANAAALVRAIVAALPDR